MIRRNGDANWIAQQFFEPHAAQSRWCWPHDETNLQFALAQSSEHFLCGQIMQFHSDLRELSLKGAKRRRQNSRGERRRVTHMQLTISAGRHSFRGFHSLVRPLEDRASFG